jgi:hypothetical protein
MRKPCLNLAPPLAESCGAVCCRASVCIGAAAGAWAAAAAASPCLERVRMLGRLRGGWSLLQWMGRRVRAVGGSTCAAGAAVRELQLWRGRVCVGIVHAGVRAVCGVLKVAVTMPRSSADRQKRNESCLQRRYRARFDCVLTFPSQPMPCVTHPPPPSFNAILHVCIRRAATADRRAKKTKKKKRDTQATATCSRRTRVFEHLPVHARRTTCVYTHNAPGPSQLPL